MIEIGLQTLLLAEATVTDLVNDAAGGEFVGVYVDAAPEGAPLDYVLITTLDDDHNETLAGGDGSGAGALHTAEVDVDCKAANPGASKALMAAVNAKLRDFTGAAGSQTVESVVRGSRVSAPEPPIGGKGHHVHVETTDYQIQYRP